MGLGFRGLGLEGLGLRVGEDLEKAHSATLQQTRLEARMFMAWGLGFKGLGLKGLGLKGLGVEGSKG